MDSHGLSRDDMKIKPRKILIIGTLGSGKTTVAQRLARDTGFPYASIDDCRITASPAPDMMSLYYIYVKKFKQAVPIISQVNYGPGIFCIQ
jgi:deoxyadenosine/deoxycytidine kinase